MILPMASFSLSTSRNGRAWQFRVRMLFGESGIGIVLTEQNAVFGSGSKHTVWFVNSLCGEIIDEYADITLIAVHLECFVANTMQGCVDSCHGSLSSCFLITGGSVHLSGKEETFDDFRLQ